MPARRRFGSVRRLPSGRWQARYWDAADNRITAPTTFATKTDAQRWLSAAETDMARGVGAGADAYVTKPFSTRELAQRVRELLAQGAA